MIRKLPANVSGLILSAPLVSAPRWIADQQLWIEELPSNIKDTIRKYEALGDYSAPAYQDAMMYFYNLHVCRTIPWPECLMRAYGKLSTEIYGYMWGPSEFTVTGTLKNYDRTNQLAGITVPVLFTCGEFDEATPAANNYYKSLIPGSEIHVFAGASHAHHLEKSAEYLEVVRDFMHRCESGQK
jgi:proline iminopeptidase